MGLSSKKVKTESTTKPIYSGQIEGAARDLNSAYQGQRGAIGQVSNDMVDLSGDLLDRFRQGDPTIGAAKNYITDTLGSDPTNNPYLDDMVSMSNDNVRNTLQARMGTRGATGGSDYYGLIGRELGKNELGMRYSDYDQAMARKAQAAGMAPSIAAGEYLPLAAGMQAGSQGAMLPIQAAAANAAGTGGLLGQYTNQTGTQKQSGGFLGDLLLASVAGASAAAQGGAFCDERLKENVRRIGQTDAGVPLYMFNYKGSVAPAIGPMAQEVAELQPATLGPDVGGYMTIQTGELR